MEEIQQTSHIILLPSPGIGHLIPLIELAKRLALHGDFSFTFAIPNEGPPSKAQNLVLESLPSSFTSVFLPLNLDDLPDDVKIEMRITLSVTRSLPVLRDAIKYMMMNKRVVALVIDLFGTDAIDVAKEFNLPTYMFYPTTGTTLSLNFQLPELDKMYSCEYRDVPEPNKLHGCRLPIHGRDLPDSLQDRSNGADNYKRVLDKPTRYKFLEGILVNSFVDLETGVFQALNEEKLDLDHPPIYPVGPLIQTGQTYGADDEYGCLKWLDEQPNGSVLFISFGSGGTLSTQQLTELALGLELSEQRFLWVVRSPSDEKANATYFTAQSVKDPFDFLPKSFLDRTKGLGLVVPSWAPQIQVLSHGSTGGFLTHCGWNSTLESVVHGVPLIAWPLFAEQRMNAVMLVDDMKVALRPRANKNGLIERSEIARVVKGLMEGHEGHEIRNKMNDLKNATTNVLSETGSSFKSLAEVALKLKRQ